MLTTLHLLFILYAVSEAYIYHGARLFCRMIAINSSTLSLTDPTMWNAPQAIKRMYVLCTRRGDRMSGEIKIICERLLKLTSNTIVL